MEAHSPLGHNGEPLADETITRIAAANSKSAAQVILRWHIQHGHIAIPKSARPDRMADNIDVFDFELSTEDIASIDALDKGATGTRRTEPRHLRRSLIPRRSPPTKRSNPWSTASKILKTMLPTNLRSAARRDTR